MSFSHFGIRSKDSDPIIYLPIKARIEYTFFHMKRNTQCFFKDRHNSVLLLRFPFFE